MIRSSTRIVGLAALTLLLTLASAVKADLVVNYINTTGSGPYTFNYDVTLGSDTLLETGRFFTIYDFLGYTGTYSVPANWVVSPAHNTGANPTTVTPIVDDINIPNITVTYTGANTSAAGSFGTFSFDSIYGQTQDGEFSSNSRSTTGSKREIDTHGFTTVPAVPLPAASWMGLALLGVMGGVYSFRRARESREQA